MALLEINNFSFSYNGSDENALSDIGLSVDEGDFVLLCGASGCGKTTLLRMLKPALSPIGIKSGSILFDGKDIKDLSPREAACDIGYVMQNPETQTVTDTVAGELAFGLQSLGMASDAIEAKLAEVAGFFGISGWYGKKTSELSGGEKQLLALASVMAMKPRLLLLDEPASQLDPVSAREFLNCLIKLNDELGITVVVSEHRLEEVFAVADKVVMMENGRIILCEKPRCIGKKLWAMPDGDKKGRGLPSAVRIYRELGGNCTTPVTVREGKNYISHGLADKSVEENIVNTCDTFNEVSVSLKKIRFGYFENQPPVLDGADIEAYRGELLCLLGGNGCGKTTLLKLICGLLRPISGEYKLFGKKAPPKKQKQVCYLPQNPLSVFSGETLEGCFLNLAKAHEFDLNAAKERIAKLLCDFGLEKLASRHPYDLSGGEQQRAAIALALFTEPEVLLLDEPTKGQDAVSRLKLAEILKGLTKSGKTVIASTHDLDFAAEYADRCAMLFGGRIVAHESSLSFFASNDYYTTAAARITRPYFKTAVTVERAVELCRQSGFSYE